MRVVGEHLAFGGIVAAAGGITMTVFSVRAVAGQSMLHSVGFDVGMGVFVLGMLIAAWGYFRDRTDKSPAPMATADAPPGPAAIHAAGQRSQWDRVKVYGSRRAILSTGDDQTFTDIEVSQGAPPLPGNFDREVLRHRTVQLARFGGEFRDVVQQHWALGGISAVEHERLRRQFRVPPAGQARHAILGLGQDLDALARRL